MSSVFGIVKRFRFLALLLFLMSFSFHTPAGWAARRPADETELPLFAKVDVVAPKELLLGKVQHAQVAITLPQGAKVLEVSARTEGPGVGLPLVRKWRFVSLKSGQPAVFKVPYQLNGRFQKGALHFDIKTTSPGAGKRAPAQHQTATLHLRR